MNFRFKTNINKTLSDIHTPVELYLKFRDKYTSTFLLESSDYKSKENSFSYICIEPIASFTVDENQTIVSYPDQTKHTFNTDEIDVSEKLNSFTKSFESGNAKREFVTNGLFGYTSYDAIPLFEDIEFKKRNIQFPLMQYHLFKYIVVFNHFNNELYIIEHLLKNEFSNLNKLIDLINQRSITQFQFKTIDEEQSNFSDEKFLKVINDGIEHCHLGNVFQVVMSRKFHQKFKGDEFNVYRALRSINPSPYLFYFDYGDFKIFGSSPEAQLTVKNKKAHINPIAGTFKRTGNFEEDNVLAEKLLKDPKENAEHNMLVDLARNDLSKNSKDVKVDSLKQIEYYSHVIHLVSKVSAKLPETYNAIKILGETYPAGTLSGAPKHRAMQIIDECEPDNRAFYGGAVGFIGLNGEFNHAIFIRSFLSHRFQLTYQAGCGVVINSNPHSELEEVNNKLSALRNALNLAETI